MNPHPCPGGCGQDVLPTTSWATGRLLLLNPHSHTPGGYQTHGNNTATLTNRTGLTVHDCGRLRAIAVIFHVAPDIHIVPTATAWDRAEKALKGRMTGPASALPAVRAALQHRGLTVHEIPSEA